MFFFSSRRRHTRYWRDWSSDVCSSDLAAALTAFLVGTTGGVSAILAWVVSPQIRGWNRLSIFIAFFALAAVALLLDALGRRSEERRVGKEGRSRWSPYH